MKENLSLRLSEIHNLLKTQKVDLISADIELL